MSLYSLALLLGLVVTSPWWLLRMLTTERYREGLAERLGLVPKRLFEDPDFPLKQVVWVHAVSVGEVLAATRLVAELEAALQTHISESRWGAPGWVVVISTTTRTGQALAKERFGANRVFYMPLDFAFAVRAYLLALRPAALVLMESELWPRMLHECGRSGIPVAVVNARVSDRSFVRGVRVKLVWGRVLRGVTLWLAQSDADARRLTALGAVNVQVSGNLKYDIRAPQQSRIAQLIRESAAGRKIVVAGSTVELDGVREESIVLQAWKNTGALLVLAPRHPERFAVAEGLIQEFVFVKASAWAKPPIHDERTVMDGAPDTMGVEIVLLDTIGDLAAVYGIADVAYVGGSLVNRGGHNPLEPAQFGVPVVMGPHFENFRAVVNAMQSVQGIRIVNDNNFLETALTELLSHPAAARPMGERGRRVFEEQQGATERTVRALVSMIEERQETPC